MTEEPKKTPLEQILDRWDIDTKIDRTELSKELSRLPNLHAKYVRLLVQYSSLVKKLNFDIYEMKRWKYDYYAGRMTQDELNTRGLQPFRFVLKSELKDYVESDAEVLKLMRKQAMMEEAQNLLESILKEINSRNYSLGKIIDWERVMLGS